MKLSSFFYNLSNLYTFFLEGANNTRVVYISLFIRQLVEGINKDGKTKFTFQNVNFGLFFRCFVINLLTGLVFL